MKTDDAGLRHLQFVTGMDFGYDKAAWFRWFEENEFLVAYKGLLTPTSIRCLRALAGEIAPDSEGYLSPDESCDLLRDITENDFGLDIEAWQRWIGERGINAYYGRVIYAGELIHLLISDKRKIQPNPLLPRTREEAHKALIEIADEDFGYDPRAWLLWFVENDLETAWKGQTRRMREAYVRMARDSGQAEE
jgi:hypothetical protein